MITLPEALAPAFVAALALQHLTELFDSYLNRAQPTAAKKLKIGIWSLAVAGVLLSFFPALRILENIRIAAVLTTATAADSALQNVQQAANPATSAGQTDTKTQPVVSTTTLSSTSNTLTSGNAQPAWNTTSPFTPKPEPASLPSWLDVIVSALIVSAGTDGFNSILKFLTYKKDETKLEANETAGSSAANPAAALTLPQPQLT